MSEKIISKEDIKKLSSLSNLSVFVREENKLADLLSNTLNYVKTLEELDTSKVLETSQVTGLVNVFQETESDLEENKGLTKEEALSNSTGVVNGLFSTKAVFER